MFAEANGFVSPLPEYLEVVVSDLTWLPSVSYAITILLNKVCST